MVIHERQSYNKTPQASRILLSTLNVLWFVCLRYFHWLPFLPISFLVPGDHRLLVPRLLYYSFLARSLYVLIFSLSLVFVCRPLEQYNPLNNNYFFFLLINAMFGFLYYYYHYYYNYYRVFFTPVFAGRLSLDSMGQQVSSEHQDSSKQCNDLDDFDSKGANYYWHHHHPNVQQLPKFSSKIQVSLNLFTFFNFHSLFRRKSKVIEIARSFFLLINTRSCLFLKMFENFMRLTLWNGFSFCYIIKEWFFYIDHFSLIIF